MSIVAAARKVAERLGGGGTLLVHGEGEWALDAHHVSVEFVHPVIVGKRSFPAMVVTDPAALVVVARPGDVVLTLGAALEMVDAARRADLPVVPLVAQRKDDMVAQYHLLWELAHLFLEDGGITEDADLAFLYGSADAADLERGAEQSCAAKSREIGELRRQVLEQQDAALDACARLIAGRVREGGRVLTFGNGGSATDAASVAAAFRRCGVAAHCLTDEPAVLTALANDVGFEVVFARQVATFGGALDVAIGLSTSGGSTNLLAAFVQARERGLLTVGFAGYDGGAMASAGTIDHLFVVPSESVHRIQEAQSSLYAELVERAAALR